MRHSAILVLVGVMGATCSGRAVADQKEAEEALKAKGLSKRLTCFCVPEEAELGKLLAVSRQSEVGKRKKAFEDAEAKAKSAKSDEDNFEAQFRQAKQEYDALQVQLAAMPGNASGRGRLVERNNFLVAMMNAAAGRRESLGKALKDARAAAAQQRESFIDYVMQLRKKYDALEARYKELSEDAEVKQALADYGEGAKRTWTLGPLKSTTDALKKLEGGVVTDSIPIHEAHGGNWLTFVTINKKNPLEFMIDTGASLISLPYKTAESLGLAPTSESPEITCTLADGRPIKCRLVVADTVRLGKFEVANVKCAVMPLDCPEATALLGMSYLGNFTFKIDKSKGVLAMSGGADQPGKAGHGSIAHSGRGDKKGGGDKASMAGLSKQEPKPPPPTGTPAEQLAKLLALDGQGDASSEGDLVVSTRGGGKLVFHPSKRGPAKTLQERFGEPDEMHKVPPAFSGDAAKDAPPWKLWTWGNVKVLVDDSGTTRYFAVSKE